MWVLVTLGQEWYSKGLTAVYDVVISFKRVNCISCWNAYIIHRTLKWIDKVSYIMVSSP